MTPTPTIDVAAALDALRSHGGILISHSRVAIGDSGVGVLTVLTVIGAIVAAIYTMRMAWSTQAYVDIATRTYHSLYRPFILATHFELPEYEPLHVLHLRFAAQNGGEAASRGCRALITAAKITDGVRSAGLERPLDQATSTPLPILPHGSQILGAFISFTPGDENLPKPRIRELILSGNLRLTITLRVSYEGMDGKRYEHESEHRYNKDIGGFEDTDWHDMSPPEIKNSQIRQAAKRINELMRRLGLV